MWDINQWVIWSKNVVIFAGVVSRIIVDTVSYSEVSQQLTCFADPLEVSLKGFGEVFSHSKFSKRFPSLHSRSFIAELSVNIFKSWISVTVDIYII